MFVKTISVITLTPLAVVFMIIGMYLKNFNFKAEKKIIFAIICILYIVSLGLNAVFFQKVPDMSSMNLGNPLLYIIHSVSGSWIIFEVAKKLEKVTFLSNIGKKSLYYYGLHYEVIGFLGAVIFKRENVLSSLLNAVVAVIILYFTFLVFDKLLKVVERKKYD